MDADTKAPRNLFQRFQAGVILDAKLVELKQFVADTAGFRRLLLSPTMRFTERDKPLAEQLFNWLRRHSESVRLSPCERTLPKGSVR